MHLRQLAHIRRHADARRFAKVRQSTLASAADGFLSGREPLLIPANTKASLLLDQGYETTAFPEMTVSGGPGAQVDSAIPLRARLASPAV
jgi:hypothetical protein